MTKDQADLIVAIAEGRWTDVWAAWPRSRPKLARIALQRQEHALRTHATLEDAIADMRSSAQVRPIFVESHTTMIYSDTVGITSAVAGPLIVSDTISVPDDLVVHLDFDAPQ